jgi:Mg2+ and Co2+ transporter CorA
MTMADKTSVNIIDALRGQQEQLKRLLAQEALIAASRRHDLFEIESQVVELKRLLTELDRVIKGHLKRG